MNINLIKILSFFIGLFITLAILSYYKVMEPFTVQEESEKEEKNNKVESFNPLITENQALIPLHGYKFMCINTYEDDNKISLREGKWYDIDSEKKQYDYNVNNYFKFDKGFDLIENPLNNNGAKLANISGIVLNGPSCFNFANNSENFELTEFSMFLVGKIDSFTTNHNIIFEMTGNTSTDNNARPSYSPSIINVDFIVRENLNYDIHICIGNHIYSGLIDDIDKDIIHTPYYLIIGLFYTEEKIGFIINKKVYEYKNINTDKIYLGSTPLIINKYGSANMKLFNFVYYKSLFHFDYFDYFIRYNNYYISGLYFETLNKKCTSSEKIHSLNIDSALIDETPVILTELDDIESKDKEKTINDVKEDENLKLRLLPKFKYDLMFNDPPSILHRIFNFL